MNSSDNSSQAPCGTCDRPVTWSDRGIVCETCGLWYHASCQSVGNQSYEALESSNVRWDCEICGSPNYSTIAFDLYGISHSHTSASFDFQTQENDPYNFIPTHCSTPTRQSRQDRSVKRPLRILVINFRSAVGKVPQISFLLQSTKPDIILGCETWMDDTIKSSEIFPAEYKIFRKDRNRNGGGVLIAANENLSCTVESNLNNSHCDCEIIWIKIKVKGSRDLLIASYYRPETGDSPSLEALEETLKAASSTNCAIFLGGYFNFPGFDWESGSIKRNAPYPTLHQNFLDSLSDHGLEQLVHKPTREGNTLDLLLTNSPSLVPRVEIVPGISDHAIVFAEVQTQPARVNQSERLVPCYRKADWTGLRTEAQTLSNSTSACDSPPDVEEIWLQFRDNVKAMLNKFIPHVKIKRKKNVPWISGDTLRLIRKRDRIHRKWKRTGRQDLKEAFKKLKSTVQRLLRREYWQYISSFFTDSPRNSDKPIVCKRLWTYIKSKKTENSGITSLKVQGKLLTDDKLIAEALNDQFQSVFSKRENLTEEEFNIRCSMPAVDPPHPPHEDILITTAGVQKLLENLNPAKASGPDGISPKVLKELAVELAPAITFTVLFQASIDTGVVPADWRTAIVAPVFKKGERYKPENYRPISLTSIPCKLLEHIVVGHVMDYCDHHNILCKEQHGFRSKHSCESQLLEISEVSEELEKGHQIDQLVIDFSKALQIAPSYAHSSS